MVIEFRLYKKFDMDLIALYNMHYPVASMMRDAVIAYANGRPLHYWVDEPTFFDANDCDAVHSRFNIPDSDTITCYMLSHIKFRCKNAFVKTVLRNALIQQNLTCFFTDNVLNQTHFHNASFSNVQMLPNIIRCSQIKEAERKKRKKRKSVTDGSSAHPDAYKKQKSGNANNNPYGTGMQPSMGTFSGQQSLQNPGSHPDMQNMYNTGLPNVPIMPNVPDGPPPAYTLHAPDAHIPARETYEASYNVPNAPYESAIYNAAPAQGQAQQIPYGYTPHSPAPQPAAQYQPQMMQNDYIGQPFYPEQNLPTQNMQNTMAQALYTPQLNPVPHQQSQQPQNYQQQQPSTYYNGPTNTTATDSYDEDISDNDDYKTENTPEIQLAGNADLLSMFDNL